MGLDRFVHFPKKAPSYDDIKHLLEDYVSGLALQIDFGKGRSNNKDTEFWTVQLPGVPTFPFRRVEGFESLNFHSGGTMWPKERWFEVVVTRKGKKVTDIDVITRLADEMTSVIAEGLVTLCVRCWKAKVVR